MRLLLLHKDLRGSAPDHHQPVAAVYRFELADVVANELGKVELAATALYVGPVQPLDVVVVEDGGHGVDAGQVVSDRLDMAAGLQDAALQRGLAGVVGNRVPAAEHELIEPGERNEFTDEWQALHRSLAEPDGAHLGQRADRAAGAAARVLHAGDQR